MAEPAFGYTPRALDRLSAFHRGERLDARCVRCGHVQRLDPGFLWRRYGDLDMAALRARLCCVVCGGRHPELVRSWQPPDRRARARRTG